MTTAMRTEILDSLSWSKPRNVMTKRGQKSVTSATATPEVLQLLETERAELSALGYSLSDWDGKKQLSRWSDPVAPGEPAKPSRKDKLSKSNVRDLIRKYTPRKPMPGFLFGRSREECQAIIRREREAT